MYTSFTYVPTVYTYLFPKGRFRDPWDVYRDCGSGPTELDSSETVGRESKTEFVGNNEKKRERKGRRNGRREGERKRSGMVTQKIHTNPMFLLYTNILPCS